MAVTAPETPITPPAVADAEEAGQVLARFVATLESERLHGAGDSIALVRLFTAVERTGLGRQDPGRRSGGPRPTCTG